MVKKRNWIKGKMQFYTCKQMILNIVLFLSGMSFILMIMPDKSYNILIWALASILTFGVLWIKPYISESILREESYYYVMAFLCCAALGTNFHFVWAEKNGMYAIMATKIGVEVPSFVLFLTIILVIASTPIVALCFMLFSKATRVAINRILMEKRLCNERFSVSFMQGFVFVFITFVVSAWALFRANYYYIDDMGMLCMFKNSIRISAYR